MEREEFNQLFMLYYKIKTPDELTHDSTYTTWVSD